jgi:4'-phosphopantetheinyl transferase
MLIPGEIHFWSLPIPADPPADRWLTLFDSDERDRLARTSHAARRREFIVAHALLRLMLAALTGAPATAFRFARGDKGKPALVAPAGLQAVQFNLSHTDGCVVCAAGLGGELGVDVEAAGRKVNLAVADRYFAASEIAWIHGLPEARRPAGFLRLWTLKEAWIKAIAKGLTQPLQDFAFSFDPLAVRFAPAIGADPADWRFARPDIGPAHLAALALRWTGAAGEPALLLRRLVSLDQAEAAMAVPAVRLALECGDPSSTRRSRAAMPPAAGHSRG